MKIETTKDRVQKSISLIERISTRNPSLPVLSCIFLEAEENILTLKSTNLEIGIITSIPVKVITPGKVAVPALILSQFLGSVWGDEKLVFEVKEGVLFISSQTIKTSIKTISYEDFPIIPKVKEGKEIKIKASDLALGLKSVWWSASVSTMKPELGSVYVYSENDVLVCVATDSFRLAEKRVKMKHSVDIGNVLLPQKNISEIIRILEEIKDEVLVSITKNQVSIESDNIFLSSRVIDGMFPDYKQILPKETKTSVVLLKQDFLNALRLSNIFLDSFHQISFSISPEKKICEVRTKNGIHGESVNTLSGALQGEPIEVSYNEKHILDMFQSITTDSVSLEFNQKEKPLLICGVGDTSFLYIIMPLNK